MKIQFMSDLHCEMYMDGGLRMLDDLPVTGDILVVAGDMAGYKEIIPAVDILCSKFYQVIFVAGNHEYYFSDRNAVHNNRVMLGRRFENFHWLDGDVFEFQGQRFVGVTGWFRDSPSNWMYENLLNDFRLIVGYKKWVYGLHEEHRKFLLENVRPGDVVITHHAPTSLSTPLRFKTSQLNRFYVADFQDVIEKCQPKLWIHGHMHEPVDYDVMGCRVVANPKGYPGEPSSFIANRIVEI